MGSISLYPILEDQFKASNPTIVLTQNLCQVCAPSPENVSSIIHACSFDPSTEIYPFQPATLMEVVDSFEEVARVCLVPERGKAMKLDFLDKMDRLKAICNPKKSARKKIKVLLLEWIDPPYDGGHWIPDMIEWVGCEVVRVGNTSIKSKQVTWDDIYTSDPDVVLVACCGFDLERNVKDARDAADKLRPLRATRENRIFACNGDLNFARPGPNILGGIGVVAKCAYNYDNDVMNAFDTLDFMDAQGFSMEWERVNMNSQDDENTDSCGIDDIEDIYPDFSAPHKAACEENKMSYEDPESGYHVFTELAHKKRGKCCGSGCRHCPYNHENVKNKIGKIQQPAFLFEGVSIPQSDKSPLVPLSEANNDNVKVLVLFFSGGKDSFLAIRATVKKYSEQNSDKICLILLNTFEAKSRIVAHQEIESETITRQAEHLNIPLIGVPLHRGSSEPYLERISRALDHVATRVGLSDKKGIDALLFGDLHLEHIRKWRDEELGKLGIPLEYPLWQVPYSELFTDLLRSEIEIKVSAVTTDFVRCGEPFNRALFERAKEKGFDPMGENGEFHTVVNVWSVSRERAIGLS
mmetsp:Transcript_12465/g.18290  ORF Transcript_12465/g.18290 Transcript_12465/m.18290 type:complete len:580 (+) Transcript_12465:2075-3814(+)